MAHKGGYWGRASDRLCCIGVAMGGGKYIRWARDDAGIRRRVVNPRLRRALRDAEPGLRGRLVSARRELARSQRWLLVAMSVFVVFFMLMCAREVRRGWPGYYTHMFTGYMVLAPAMAAVHWWLGTGIRKGVIRRVALEHDLCPS